MAFGSDIFTAGVLWTEFRMEKVARVVVSKQENIVSSAEIPVNDTNSEMRKIVFKMIYGLFLLLQPVLLGIQIRGSVLH